MSNQKKTKKVILNYKEYGITLIALVVTIVVLLILAGITLNLVLGESGVINRARYASNTWANASQDETILMAEMDEQIGELIDGSGELDGDANTLPNRTYTAGEEITFGDEQFYVIADDGATVRLLAKYCLNQEGTEQTETLYIRKFSNSSYWSQSINGESLNLQSQNMISKAREDGEVQDNAILIAINYGQTKGVSGRLLNSQEYYSLSGNDIIGLTTWNEFGEEIGRYELLDRRVC